RGVLALLLAARPIRIDKGDDDLTRHSAYRRRYRQSGAWRNAAAPNAVRRYFDIIEYRAHRFSAPFRGSGDGDRSQRGMKFKFTTAGESHGPALIAVVEGVPAGLEINRAGNDRELWRRQRGYGRGGRMKIEDDKVKILGGVRHGKALGSPISMMIENKEFVHWWDVMAVDALDEEPANPRKLTRPRPGHADFAGGIKYQTKDLRNILVRASARETAARVAAGATTLQILSAFDVEVMCHRARYYALSLGGDHPQH